VVRSDWGIREGGSGCIVPSVAGAFSLTYCEAPATRVARPLAASTIALALTVSVLTAQVVESPQPFDSNGKVFVITPSAAARIGLGPPAWRVLGDFVEARLYQNPSGHVIVVTRRDQSLERHDLSLADVNAIRTKVNALPPQFALSSQQNAGADFARNQAIMGIAVYGPALSLAIANETTGRVSTHLLTSGAAFFAATQIARRTQITPEMTSLSSHMGLRGALMGLGLTFVADASGDARAVGALVGGLGGTTAGLSLGRSWEPSAVVASQVGSDAITLTTLGIIASAQGSDGISDAAARREVLLLSGATVAGYVLGQRYGSKASHNITAGDGGALWVTGALGIAASSIAFAGSNKSSREQALAITGGYVAGVVAGELLLARRFDLSVNDASLLGLGAGAGSLIGLGVARLIDDEGVTDRRTMAFTTLGGVTGLFLTHFLLAPPVDAGRTTGSGNATARSSLKFSPAALAMAAAKVPGNLPLMSLNFR